MPKSPKEIIKGRGATHGDWYSQSGFAQTLKRLMREETNAACTVLPAYQREALEMICVKISRILHGNHNERDHWDDIAGYALLGLPKENENATTNQSPDQNALPADRDL